MVVFNQNSDIFTNGAGVIIMQQSFIYLSILLRKVHRDAQALPVGIAGTYVRYVRIHTCIPSIPNEAGYCMNTENVKQAFAVETLTEVVQV